MPDTSHDAVRVAQALLGDLLTEFHFLATTDKAAALSAIFAVVVRPLLSHAPAFHVRARVLGSGKTYLCELIGAFACPDGRQRKGKLSNDLRRGNQGPFFSATYQPRCHRI